MSLYNKYRPSSFKDIRGSVSADILKKQIDLNKMSHAYIFAGTPGTGKTTDTAKKFLELCKANNKDKQIISIVCLTNTANQHIKTFEDENIKLNDYRICK